MTYVMIAAALCVLAALCALMAWRRRVRSDERLGWQATRETVWTTAELDALRLPEPADALT